MRRSFKLILLLFSTLTLAIGISSCSTDFEDDNTLDRFVSIISPKDTIGNARYYSYCSGYGYHMFYIAQIVPVSNNESATSIFIEDTVHTRVSDLNKGDNIAGCIRFSYTLNKDDKYPYFIKNIKKGKLIVEDVGPHYATLRFENYTLEPLDTTFKNLVINAKIRYNETGYLGNEPAEPGSELTPANLIGDWIVTDYISGNKDINELDVFAYYLKFGYFNNRFCLEDSRDSEDPVPCSLTGNKLTTDEGFAIEIISMDRKEIEIKVPNVFGSMKLKMKRPRNLNDSDMRTILTENPDL